MKTPSFALSLRSPLPFFFGIALSLFLLSPSSRAGVVLLKNDQAEAGNLTETEDGLSYQTPYGTIEFKKENIAWYSTAAEIDTFYKAAQKALEQNELKIAVKLLNVSIAKEPATQNEAKVDLENVLNTLRDQVLPQNQGTGDTPAVATGHAENLSPEEKIKRGNKLIADGKAQLEKAKAEPAGSLSKSSSEKSANQKIADGKKLIEQGQRELAELQAQMAADETRKQEIQELIAYTTAVYANENWTKQEKLANTAVVIVFGLVVFFSLWQIATQES